MNPISPQTKTPYQATSASISTPSYSSAAKKAVSSPPVAAGSSSQSQIVAVGNSGQVQPSHGKSNSIVPMNGKPPISPAVPAVSTPAIAYSNSVANGAPNHSRKPSVTIGASNRNSMNGGPVGGSNGKIQFGSITDSPATSHSTPQLYQSNTSGPMPIGNPRISDPSHSPSPIPQPSASGGRPPIVGPGNGVNFGSFGGDCDRYIRQPSGPQPPSAPGAQQNCHSRNDSSQSIPSDLSNQPGRGGFPHHGNRGRGGFQNQYTPQQMGGYPPPNNSFRNSQNQGRSGIPPFQSQGRPPFPNSPHQTSRSPALTNSSIPATPNINPSMPMPNQQQFPSPYFPQHMAGPQYSYAPQFDTRGIPLQGAPYLYPQIQNMAYIPGPPQSPQTAFQQPHYTPGQYAPQSQQMSRTSSQISEHRPASSMGQPQAPSMTIIPHPLTSQPKSNINTPVSFTRPTRKNAAIPIKRPDGEAVDIESFKAPASPAPSARARTPPIIASTPIIPLKPGTTPRATEDVANVKTSDQIKQEMIEKVKKAVAEENPPIVKSTTPNNNSNFKHEEEKIKSETKVVEDSKLKKDESVVVPSQSQPDEEEDIEKLIAEMEAAEAEREKKEAEILKKRDAEREIANAEKKKLNEAAQIEENRRLKEQEQENQRLEDEREKRRAEAEVKNASESKPKTVAELLKETLKRDPPSIIPNLKGVTSNSSAEASEPIPASDEPMGPPPRVSTGDKRTVKPSALNLAPIHGKPLDPPQPSAALMSLKSARFLTTIDPMIYPPSINSPNPALNQAVKDKGRSFKYDKEFLLQFQKVFTEKPSMEFESQIKALIGESDTGTTRPSSTRVSDSGMASRANSNRNSTQAFNMGAFNAPSGGKSLPPGTTSEQRFAMASGSIQRPTLNSIASFTRTRGTGFPAANTMARNPSSSGIPHSPRQQSRRGNNSNKGYNSSNSKQEAQAAKTMPLTAGMDVKPIQISATGWKPRSVGNPQSVTGITPSAPGISTHLDPDMVQRKVKAALNKMTPEKFDKIADQIFAIAAQSKDEADGRTLRQVIQLTFEKATDEAHWASMYAKFCKRMLETMSPEIKDETILDKNGEVVSGGNLFRKYLLNRCQEEFERGWKIDLPAKPDGQRGDSKSEEAVMLSDEYYIAAAAKRRGLGLVQFIGELYKLSMLTERIMHQCVKKLVDYKGIPDEAEVESLTKLLKTIGANLDSTEKGKQIMDAYFARIQNMIETPELPSRLRFMLMDIVDLRKKRWASKESNKGPKTLEEVRVEAEEAAAQKAAENARSSQRSTGAGGRMPLGRNDNRNFSNQYGSQQPPDTQKNIVGMDELRRLTNKSNINTRTSSQQLQFGPSSMFSRSGSGRKMGAGSSFGRAGEDSGASSRTGTPPQLKEKESATSVNTFSVLAGLPLGETENPASPPSTAASPSLYKTTPAVVDKSDK